MADSTARRLNAGATSAGERSSDMLFVVFWLVLMVAIGIVLTRAINK